MDWKKKLKFVLIVVAFAILILIIFSNIFKMTRVTEKDFRTYKQGLYFLNKNDFQNAYYNFSNISKNSALYSIALLRQGLCADDLNDSETAIKKLRLYIEKYPDSMFIQKAYYTLAQNYFRVNDYTKAEKTFNIIRKDFKDSDYSIAANYYLGLIFKEQSIKSPRDKERLNQKAKAYLFEYLKDSPDGRFSQNCIENILQLDIPLTSKEYFIIGKSYYLNGQQKLALDNFNKSYMAYSWGYLSLIYKKQGFNKKSREIFEHNYPLYSKNIEEKELLSVIENYALISPYGENKGWEKALSIAEKSNAQGIDYILYKLTKYKKDTDKNLLYERIYQEFPEGKFASDALSNLFWNSYIQNNYQKAYTYGFKHLKDYPNTIAAPQMAFWMGELSQKIGHKNEAMGFFQRVLDNYPDSYYAYRVAQKYGISKISNSGKKFIVRLNEKFYNPKFPVKHANISDDNISLINEILKLNDYKLLGEIDKNNKVVLSWINYKEGNYSTSALLARDAIANMDIKPDFSDEIYKLAYPLHYQEAINDYSYKYGLDSFLVISLIREESYFNPKTKSFANALGLMQLLPNTARHIANMASISYGDEFDLYNPEKNIELGCAFLYSLKATHTENDVFVIAAYNAGANAVLGWKNSLQYKNIDEFVEKIPYPETKEYVKKVFRSYWVYTNIYLKYH